MCGRFIILDERENEEIRNIVDEINRRYNEPDAPQAKFGQEIFPTDYIPAIALKKSGNHHIGLVKWGFPGYQDKGVLINARAETLEEKPTFRKALSNRCIIPATGYYEWQQTPAGKVKHLIRTDKTLFYMAGLFNTFTDKSGKPYVGAVIITTDPAPGIAHIHNRMPALLDKLDINKWLTGDFKAARELLIPYTGEIQFSVA